MVDCQWYYEHLTNPSNGIYTLEIGNYSFTARCEFDAGHGWTVLQRRYDGSEDFDRDWQDYKSGFGSQEYEHWIGEFIQIAKPFF